MDDSKCKPHFELYLYPCWRPTICIRPHTEGKRQKKPFTTVVDYSCRLGWLPPTQPDF